MHLLRPCLIFIGLFLTGFVSNATPPITGDPGATIEDLIREETLVTFVLTTGARDYNMRVTGVYPDSGTITFTTPSGEPSAYPASLLREIRVQKGRVDTSRRRSAEGALTADDRKLVARAADRALEIFNQSQRDQSLRIVAAMILAASEHENSRNAEFYLRELANGNDVPTAMTAGASLWIAGVEPADDLLQEGFFSGNRNARAMAAKMAGLTENERFLSEVRTLLRDPAVEYYPAAARAVGRLGDRASLPELYDGIRALRDEKAEAAVFALNALGGTDVRQRMLDMQGSARGLEWFRVVRVLYALGDSHAKQILIENALRQPSFERTAAILLGKDGVLEGIEWLRDYLKKPEDPNVGNLVFRARVGITLLEAGDIQAKTILQGLLTKQPNEIYARGRSTDQAYKQQAASTVQIQTCNIIGDSMRRGLLPLLVGPVQSADPKVALAACSAMLQIGNPKFGERLAAARL